jgi:hypothetical protein
VSKHTEGPWRLDGFKNLVQSISNEGISIRCCVSIPNYKHPEAEANAQLIAAAPELLEALELAESILSKIPYSHIAKAHATSSIACNTAPESFIRATIDKAKGEQQ